MYLLDTNICIQHLNKHSPKIIECLKSIGKDNVYLCSVVKAELYYGASKSNFPDRTLEKIESFVSYFESLTFNDSAAKLYGDIRATLERKGLIIGPNDLMIAAIAKVNNLILVTNNTKEFTRVEKLKLENWT